MEGGTAGWSFGALRRLGVVVASFAVALCAAAPASAHDAVVVGPMLSSPVGVAVDHAGDLFIADRGNGRVVEDSPIGGGNYQRSVIAQGLSTPEGVAVNGAGDVFIADSGDDRVLEEKPASGGSYTQSVVAQGLNDPVGLAADGSGDVFVADSGNGRILEETPTGSGWTQTVVATGLVAPDDVAVDAAGDLFVADTGQSEIVEETPIGGGVYDQTVAVSGFVPLFVAVDAGGDLYVTSGSGGSQVLKETPTGGGAYSASQVTPLNQVIGSGVAVDGAGDVFVSVDPAQVFVNYIEEESPNGSGGYTESFPGSSGVAFPQGLAADASGDVYVETGSTGEVVEEKPNGAGGYSQVAITETGTSPARGLAVDGSGDVFIAAPGEREVIEATPGDPFYGQTVIASGLSSPYGVALDASGDVFVTDNVLDEVLEETPSGGGAYTQSVVAGNLSAPTGIAVDASGNLFVAQSGNGTVIELTPDGAGGYTQSSVATGLSSPDAVAVDASGVVFATDTGNNLVVGELPNGSGGYSQFIVDTPQGNGLSDPDALAVNAAGDLFIADRGNNRVLAHDLNGAQAQTVTFATSGLTYGQTGLSPASSDSELPITYSDATGDCALDGSGLLDLTAAGPCTVTANQAGGIGWGPATATDTFTVSKAPLTIVANNASTPYGKKPTLGYTLTGFVNHDTSAVMTGKGVCSLEVGVGADVGTYPNAIVCLPGTLSSPNYTVTSRTAGTLTITPLTQTITFTSRAVTPTFGGSYVVAAKGGGSGKPVTFSIDPASGAGVCSVSGSTVSFTGAGECLVDADQAATQDYLAAPTRQQEINVAKAKLTVTANPQSRPAGQANPPLTATITGFVEGQTLATSGVTGTAKCTTTAKPSSPPGSYPITCSLGTLAAAPSTYAFSFAAGTLTVT